MLRKTLSFISVLLLGAGAAGAQNPETPAARPRTVGVVMSGGGAKGLYHIGVLEALEENGVPACISFTNHPCSFCLHSMFLPLTSDVLACPRMWFKCFT